VKQFSCGDVVPGCRRVFSAPDQQGIMNAVAEHAAEDHGVPQLSDDLRDAVVENTTDV
jgi:predicted small metal-binding protein